jgi:cellulose synthase (UDP-forming)
MSPQTLLARWRDRWDKPTAEDLRLPYVYGKAKQWSDRFAHAQAWSRPALCAGFAVLGLVLMAVLLQVPLSLHGQIVASATLVGVALFVRRYGGLLATLVLLWLSLCATGRYLLWRFGQSLGNLGGADYVAAFVLCAAELALSLLVALTIARALWPATRALAPLPRERSQWPDVDIFLVCAGQAPETVEAAARAALALDWPQRKRTLHLLDGPARDALGALAASLGATYLPGKTPQADAMASDAAALNGALGHAKSSLVLVLECATPVPPGLLAATAGAFLHSPALAMLQSPHHFLAPAPSPAALARFAPQQASFALLRRHALEQAGGAEEQVTSWQPPTTHKLQALGYACSYAGVPSPSASEPAHDPDRAAPAMVRLDRPFSGWTLYVQDALERLEALLRFYVLAPRCVFWAAPLLALLAGTVLIDAPAELLAAFLLPHLAHGHLALTRMRTRSRMGLVQELREMLLAAFMLLPTALSVLRTLAARWRRGAASARPAPFGPAWQALHALLMLLHLAALACGAWVLAAGSAGAAADTATVLAMLWCGYHLLLLLAMLAVSEEARQIGLHLHLQAVRPAMLAMPLGRTLACTTSNFPATELTLRLPVATPVKPGSTIRIALFEGYDEWTFATRVLAQDGSLLRVLLDEDASERERYGEFGARALARGADWPAWLAGRTADQPLPAWITTRSTAAMIAILDFATHGRYLHWLQLKHWKTLWKSNNEQAH